MTVLIRIFLVIFILTGIVLGIKSVFELYISFVSIHSRNVRHFDGEITGYHVKTEVIENGFFPEYLSWFPQPEFRYKMGNEWRKATDKNIQFFRAFKVGQKVKVAVSSHGIVLIDFHTRYAFWGLVFIISLFFIFLPIFVWPMINTSQAEILDKPVFKDLPFKLPFKLKYFLYIILGLFVFTVFMAGWPYIYQLMPRGKGGKLINALRDHNRKEVSILIKKGANINAKEKYTELSVLMIALEEDQRWIVDELLKRGAKINDKDSVGRTPLFYAVKSKNEDAVEKLIKKGAKLSCSFEDILILAIAQKHSKIARLLIEGGHPLKYKYEQYKNITAGDFAILAGIPEIVKLIYEKKGIFTAPFIFVEVAIEDKSKIDALINSSGFRNINFGKVTLEDWIRLCKNR